MHAKFERLLSKSLTTLEVMAYYLVVHTGHGLVRVLNTFVDGRISFETGIAIVLFNPFVDDVSFVCLLTCLFFRYGC